MYIEPNSTIQLFSDLRLDKGYSNTMWFANVSAQDTFFGGLNPITLTNNSYQRKDIGVFRCGLGITQLHGINYMRFRNASFENKWFYAFINRVEYVNNAMCNVYYTIDVIQTYMFDWTLHECMIERQHSTTDVAGDNLQPEGLELGDTIANGGWHLETDICSQCRIVLCVADVNDRISDLLSGLYDEYSDSFVINNYPTPLTFYQFNRNNVSRYQNFAVAMERIQADNSIDSIVGIYVMPNRFVDLASTDVAPSITYHIDNPTSLNGHTPVNKKLLTYPYCFVDIFNDNNENIQLRYENFYTYNYTNQIKIYGLLTTTPELLLVPNYDGQNENIRYAISCQVPQVPYITDQYKAWLAMNYDQTELSKQFAQDTYDIQAKQNAVNNYKADVERQKQITSGIIASAGGGGVMVASGGLLGAGAFGQGAVNASYAPLEADIAKQLNDLNLSENELYSNYKIASGNIAESVARKLPASANTGYTANHLCVDRKGFFIQPMSIRRQFAERIDKYFTMFGYAQNKVDTPNIHARQYFTYIKTSGSSVSGIIPEDDKEIINTVFDRGIRFWTDYTNFENYTVNNAII